MCFCILWFNRRRFILYCVYSLSIKSILCFMRSGNFYDSQDISVISLQTFNMGKKKNKSQSQSPKPPSGATASGEAPSGAGDQANALPAGATEMQNRKWKESDLVDLTPTAHIPFEPATTPPAFCQGGIFSEAGEEYFVPPPPEPLFERAYIRFGGLFALLLAVLAATKPSVSS
jgi:hypothetical protein